MSETAVETEPNYDMELDGDDIYGQPEPAAAIPAITDQVPDGDDVEQVGKALELYVTSQEEAAKALVPVDDMSLQACADAVAVLKRAATSMEERRVERVTPLNSEVTKINKAYTPWVKRIDGLWRRVNASANQFVDERQQALEAEQRRRDEEAKTAQALLDQQAEDARIAAQAAQEKGDTVAAVHLEAEAEQLQLKAAEVVPEVLPQQETRIATGCGTLSLGGAKMTWSLTGWDKKKAIPAMSPLFASLVGDITKLPEGVQFLLKVCDVSPVHLNALYKVPGAKFPAPFKEIKDYGKSSLR